MLLINQWKSPDGTAKNFETESIFDQKHSRKRETFQLPDAGRRTGRGTCRTCPQTLRRRAPTSPRM